jgi:ATP-binding cassette, subfamily C, bacteriocin exporter
MSAEYLIRARALVGWREQGRAQLFRRYVFVRQTGDSDCGAAAIATVALHYRIPLSLPLVRALAGTDRSGATMRGLLEAGEKLGFSAKAARGSYDSLFNVPLPAIVHVRTTEELGHFIVLYRVHVDFVIIADPVRGIEKLSRTEFCSRWTGHILLMVPDQMRGSGGGTNTSVAPARRFIQLLSCHKSVLAEAFACALLMTVLGIATSRFIQHLVDSVLVRKEQQLLNALAFGMVLVAVFRTAFGALRQYLIAYIGQKVDLSLMAGYARHTLGLPLPFFEMRQVGEILSRVTDAAKVREAIRETALTAVLDGTLICVLFAALWFYDWALALVAFVFVLAVLAGFLLHHPGLRRRSMQAMERAGQLYAHLMEDVSGIETVKAFGAERARTEQTESRLVAFTHSVLSLQRIGNSMSSLALLFTSIAAVAVLWCGSYRVMDGALTVGQLMAFYTLLASVLEPLERVASVNMQLQDALAAVDRLYEIMDLELEQSCREQKATFRGGSGAIELRAVSFRYSCRGNVLDNVNLRVPAGKTVAIIGESGSGKSTLLKLLMGFYTPCEGGIFIDGMDMRDFTLASLRSRIGLVSQDPFIFSGTVRDNIAFGRPSATLQEVIQAATAAGLDEFIRNLPGRYDTAIGERGANLSGGQRQRLAIARALIKDPEILIFDEATSHLDTATEHTIQRNLRQAVAGKTVILVAHRLSTIREADFIYVLRNGRVAEQGTHRELMTHNGLYAALCRIQSGAAADCVLPSIPGLPMAHNGHPLREELNHA